MSKVDPAAIMPVVQESPNWGQHGLDAFVGGMNQFRRFLQDLTELVDRQREQQLEELRSQYGAQAIREAVDQYIAANNSVLQALIEHFDGLVEADKTKVYAAQFYVPAEHKEIFSRLSSVRHRSDSHKGLLGRTVLIGLVTQIELLISHLAHEYFLRHPKAFSNSDTKLSLAEVLAFDSVEELRLQFVSKRVESILRGSVEDWNDFLKKHGTVSMEECATDWPRLVEVFQRRNLLVHDEGRVNRIYVSKTDPSLVKEFFGDDPLHAKVEVSSDYLFWALDEVEGCGLAVALRSLLHWRKGEAEEITGYAIDTVYSFMIRGQWSVVKAITKSLKERCATAAQGWILTLNYWLACKRLGDWESVRKEAEKADLSALDPMFRLAHLALTGRVDEFFLSVRQSGRIGLTVKALEEWPVLEEIRQDDRFNAVLEERRRVEAAV